jgi:hypothetical protein
VIGGWRWVERASRKLRFGLGPVGRRCRLILAALIAVSVLLGPNGLTGRPSAGTAMASAAAPILLVLDSSSSNPFGPYLGEILHAEGLNAFQTDQLGNLTAPELASYPIVILIQTTLTSAPGIAWQ